MHLVQVYVGKNIVMADRLALYGTVLAWLRKSKRTQRKQANLLYKPSGVTHVGGPLVALTGQGVTWPSVAHENVWDAPFDWLSFSILFRN